MLFIICIDVSVQYCIIKRPSTLELLKGYSNWCYYQIQAVTIIGSNLFTSRKYFTMWYFCTVQIIIPINHFNKSGFRVTLDWIDFNILSKWFNTPYCKVYIWLMLRCVRAVAFLSCGVRGNETWCGSHPCCIYQMPNRKGSDYDFIYPEPNKIAYLQPSICLILLFQ